MGLVMNVRKTKQYMTQQAKAITEVTLGYHDIRTVLKKLLKKKELSEKEKERIKELEKRYGKNLYSTILFELAHIDIQDEGQAKALCRDIASHKARLNMLLKRNIGFEIAALDYIKNIAGITHHFSIIEKSKMEKIAHQAVADDKTESYTCSMLYSDIEKEISRTKRYGRKFSVIFIDVDNFKTINDTYGHLTGDKILLRLSDLMSLHIRKTDSVYRYGGDEFVILLPETNTSDAVRIALKIKNILRTKRNFLDSINHSISLSMGIATFGDYRITTVKKILQSADKAVYNAKKTGRNKICIYKGRNIEEVSDTIKHYVKNKKKRKVFHGKTIVQGITYGSLLKHENIITRKLEIYTINEEELDHELKRIEKAIDEVYEDLDKLHSTISKKLDKKHTDIITSHKLILKDQELIESLKKEIREKRINSEAIVKRFFKDLENKFNSFTAPEFKTKAKDIVDIGEKILKKLLNIKTHDLERLSENNIIFSRRILPTDIIHIQRNKLKGIITLEGSEYSHAGILAKAFNIPFITHINAEFKDMTDRSDVVMDGYTGKIILNPTQRDKEKIIKKKKQEEEKKIDKRFTGSLQLTVNSEPVHIYANIEADEDIHYAKKFHSRGIGLTRLEYIYLLRPARLSHQELYHHLYHLFRPVHNIPITIRLLDIGGDKFLPYMKFNKSERAKMGTMGIRFLLDHQDLLRDQLKTCLALHDHYTIRILLPMVTLPEEIKKTKKLLRQLTSREKKEQKKPPQIGAMIEVPSAVFLLDRILKDVDFISIGSNDLVQYTMVADREDLQVSKYFKKGNDVIITIIKTVIQKAKEAGIECGLCGELAGNTYYTDKLLKAGLRNFSVSPYLIPALRKKIYEKTEYIAGSSYGS
jgi:phosphoenolpyruvate-protein phosphotransferase (PTS system enzyme I)